MPSNLDLQPSSAGHQAGRTSPTARPASGASTAPGNLSERTPACLGWSLDHLGLQQADLHTDMLHQRWLSMHTAQHHDAVDRRPTAKY